MAIYQVNAGDRILAADINQFYNLLKGVTGSGESVTLIYNAGAIIVQPSADPAAGTRGALIKNAAGTTLASITYDGKLRAADGTTAAPGLTFDLEPGSGLYRNAPGVISGVSLGIERFRFDTVGFSVDGGVTYLSGSTPQMPNLVPNSDFARRTIFGLAMPEAYVDTSGATLTDGTTLGTVAANVLTAGNTGAWGIREGLPTWRDARFSVQFQNTANDAANQLRLGRWQDANNWIIVEFFGGVTNTIRITKNVAGVITAGTQIATGLVMTLNNWYWLEIEFQGTNVVAKIFSSGAAAVAKSAATLGATITPANSGLAINATDAPAGYWWFFSSPATAAKIGGMAASPGGAYVETWLPESMNFTFTAGGLGGQAVGYDESADSGPLAKQNALRFYIPPAAANTRRIQVDANTPDGSGAPSAAYTASFYLKTSGATVPGMVNGYVYEAQSNLTLGAAHTVADAGEIVWTRKTVTWTNASTARRFAPYFYVGDLVANHGGTFWIGFHQIEQGSVATAWRNAPADDAPIVWELLALITSQSTTSVSVVELEPTLAGNFFLPSDCTLEITLRGGTSNNGVGNANIFQFQIDGSGGPNVDSQYNSPVANTTHPLVITRRAKLSAGKHRISMFWRVSAGTGSFGIGNELPRLHVTAYRGK